MVETGAGCLSFMTAPACCCSVCTAWRGASGADCIFELCHCDRHNSTPPERHNSCWLRLGTLTYVMSNSSESTSTGLTWPTERLNRIVCSTPAAAVQQKHRTLSKPAPDSSMRLHQSIRNSKGTSTPEVCCALGHFSCQLHNFRWQGRCCSSTHIAAPP